MNLLNTLGIGRLFQSSKQSRSSRGVCIIDAAFMNQSGGGRGRMSPSAQNDVLRQLSRFSKRENLPVVVVFEGPANDQSFDRDSFQDIEVNYCETPSDLPGLLIRLSKHHSRKSKAVIVTSDRQTEKRAIAAGCATLRGSTLRKTLEAPSGNRDEGGRQRSHSSSSRRPQRYSGSNNQQQQQQSEQQASDTVRELIDLVE